MCGAASIAALKPAPPAPTITPSKECLTTFMLASQMQLLRMCQG